MNITKKKTVDMLTSESVSILTQQFIEIDGEQTQVGANHRASYENSISGRKELEKNEPSEIVECVKTMWGDAPTVFYEDEDE